MAALGARWPRLAAEPDDGRQEDCNLVLLSFLISKAFVASAVSCGGWDALLDRAGGVEHRLDLRLDPLELPPSRCCSVGERGGSPHCCLIRSTKADDAVKRGLPQVSKPRLVRHGEVGKDRGQDDARGELGNWQRRPAPCSSSS
mmetsp:Transcript_3584/g.7015  ORF Transcript_3584/g.7015 Transcript_3584/m.7015 type:complete len:144 (-) Transcript_3584:672-1103(-)